MSQSAIKDRPTPAPVPPQGGLSGRSLPRLAPLGFANLSIGLGVGVSMAVSWESRVQWGLISALLFVVISYIATSIVENRRQAKDRLATSVVWVCFILAVIPLLSLAWVTISKGVKVLDGYFLSHSMSGVLDADTGGGVYHALIGTIEQVLIATVIAAPIGLLTAIYLVEYGSGKLAKAVTFFVDVMTGIPSIVAALFILATWNLMLGFGPSGFSRRAGARHPDDAGGRPLHRGNAQTRPQRAARGLPRPGHPQVAHDPQGGPAHRDRRHHHGHHARGGPYRRMKRPPCCSSSSVRS